MPDKPLTKYLCKGCGTLILKGVLLPGSVVEHKCRKCGIITTVTMNLVNPTNFQERIFANRAYNEKKKG